MLGHNQTNRLIVCQSLISETGPLISLVLRSCELTAAELIALSKLFRHSKPLVSQLKNFSISYNEQVGDEAFCQLLTALPPSVDTIGAVGCALTDETLTAINDWLTSTSNLQMVCIENNLFNAESKVLLQATARKKQGLLFVI
jgi:hypothetical protein